MTRQNIRPVGPFQGRSRIPIAQRRLRPQPFEVGTQDFSLLEQNVTYRETSNLQEPVEILENPEVVYTIPQEPIVPEVIGRPPQHYGAEVGEVEPTLGMPVPPPPLREAQVSNLPVVSGVAEIVVEEIEPVMGTSEVPVAETCGGNPPGLPEDGGSSLTDTPFTFYTSWNKSPGGPGGPGGSGGSGGSGGFGGFADSEGGFFKGGPPLAFYGHVFFWLLIIQLGYWLVEYGLKKIRDLAIQYQEARKALTPPPSVEVRRFGNFADFVIGTIVAFLTPEIAQRFISNISNRWTRAICSSLWPVARLGGIIGITTGLGAIFVKCIQQLSTHFNPFLDQLVGNILRPVSASDGRIVFATLFVKCLVGGIFAGGICRVVFQYERQSGNTLRSLNTVVVLSVSLVLLYKDQVYCAQIGQALVNTPGIAFLMNSQLGRWALLLGSVKLLGQVEHPPYTLTFYVMFVYLFRLFSLAATATPNIF